MTSTSSRCAAFFVTGVLSVLLLDAACAKDGKKPAPDDQGANPVATPGSSLLLSYRTTILPSLLQDRTVVLGTYQGCADFELHVLVEEVLKGGDAASGTMVAIAAEGCPREVQDQQAGVGTFEPRPFLFRRGQRGFFAFVRVAGKLRVAGRPVSFPPDVDPALAHLREIAAFADDPSVASRRARLVAWLGSGDEPRVFAALEIVAFAADQSRGASAAVHSSSLDGLIDDELAERSLELMEGPGTRTVRHRAFRTVRALGMIDRDHPKFDRVITALISFLDSGDRYLILEATRVLDPLRDKADPSHAHDVAGMYPTATDCPSGDYHGCRQVWVLKNADVAKQAWTAWAKAGHHRAHPAVTPKPGAPYHPPAGDSRKERVMVTQAELLDQRIEGSVPAPPADIRDAMARDGRDRLNAELSVWVDSKGVLWKADIMISSRYAVYDELLRATIKTWRFHPDPSGNPLNAILKVSWPE